MTHYHAVMMDECGGEFGVSFEAKSREEAYDYLQENYPESQVDQLEDSTQTAEREKRIYGHAHRMAYDDDYAYYNEEY